MPLLGCVIGAEGREFDVIAIRILPRRLGRFRLVHLNAARDGEAYLLTNSLDHVSRFIRGRSPSLHPHEGIPRRAREILHPFAHHALGYDRVMLIRSLEFPVTKLELPIFIRFLCFHTTSIRSNLTLELTGEQTSQMIKGTLIARPVQ